MKEGELGKRYNGEVEEMGWGGQQSETGQDQGCCWTLRQTKTNTPLGIRAHH